MDELSVLVFEPDTSIAVGPYEAPTQYGAPDQYGSPENSIADGLIITSRNGPDGTVVGSGGPNGQDAGPTGQDASPIVQDAGPTGQDAGPIGQDAGPNRQDAGPTGGLGLARRYPSSVDRCGICEDETEDPVCGSDGKTYENSCELENYACRKYWDIVVVNQGPCESTCPGVELGMYSGFGSFHAKNKGSCHHDFFRCCGAAKMQGIAAEELKSCCNERFSQCCSFVGSKPWRAGIERFGR